MSQNSKNEFVERFNITDTDFSGMSSFTDEFGFSISKNRKQNGREFASLYKFYITKEALLKDGNLKPITIEVSYGEKVDDGSILISPTSIERKINWPLDLLNTNEFFYDIQNGEFFYKGRELSPKELLFEVEKLHLKPTKFWGGLPLRVRLFFWRVFLTNFLKCIHYLLVKFLYLISGIKVEKSIWSIKIRSDIFGGEKSLDEKISFFASNEKINILGYKASAWAVVVYSIIHLVLYILWYSYRVADHSFIQYIFTNGFLTIMYVIPTLVFFERLLPVGVKGAIRFISEQFHKTSFKRVKI